jgi:hypothetical protein
VPGAELWELVRLYRVVAGVQMFFPKTFLLPLPHAGNDFSLCHASI